MSNNLPPRFGTCYVDAYRYLCYECEIDKAVLVHGIIHGRNDLKNWIYGHAWIEIGDVAFQPVSQKGEKAFSLGFLGRKESFYKVYKVKEKTLRRYTKDEAMANGLKNKHFGPWHELGLGDKGYMKIED